LGIATPSGKEGQVFEDNGKIDGMSELTGAQDLRCSLCAAPALLTAVAQKPGERCFRSLPLVTDYRY